MGSLDYVMVPCPKCGEKRECQSKGGECVMAEFSLADAPLDVLADVNRHAPHDCDKCGASFFVDLTKRAAINMAESGSREKALSEVQDYVAALGCTCDAIEHKGGHLRSCPKAITEWIEWKLFEEPKEKLKGKLK